MAKAEHDHKHGKFERNQPKAVNLSEFMNAITRSIQSKLFALSCFTLTALLTNTSLSQEKAVTFSTGTSPFKPKAPSEDRFDLDDYKIGRSEKANGEFKAPRMVAPDNKKKSKSRYSIIFGKDDKNWIYNSAQDLDSSEIVDEIFGFNDYRLDKKDKKSGKDSDRYFFSKENGRQSTFDMEVSEYSSNETKAEKSKQYTEDSEFEDSMTDFKVAAPIDHGGTDKIEFSGSMASPIQLFDNPLRITSNSQNFQLNSFSGGKPAPSKLTVESREARAREFEQLLRPNSNLDGLSSAISNPVNGLQRGSANNGLNSTQRTRSSLLQNSAGNNRLLGQWNHVRRDKGSAIKSPFGGSLGQNSQASAPVITTPIQEPTATVRIQPRPGVLVTPSRY